jgi:hypothetical protein
MRTNLFSKISPKWCIRRISFKEYVVDEALTYTFFFLLPPYSGARSHTGAQGVITQFLDIS